MDLRRRHIVSRAASISVSTMPFGIAFGAIAAGSHLSLLETIGFSTVVFTGSAQFAAVAILADGGGVAAAVTAGLLLNLRSFAFGVLLAPDLRGPVWWRALVSQLVIDESTAVAAVEDDTTLRRFGFLAGGLGVYLCFNLATIIGAVAIGSTGDAIQRYGLDATIPAAFLGLLWPRLSDPVDRSVAVVATVLTLAVSPFTPTGIAVIVGVAAVLIGHRRV